jgi:hypothetical protein
MATYHDMDKNARAKRRLESATLYRQDSPNPMPAFTSSGGLVQRIQLDPKAMSPADVMYLQRTVGNRAVQRLLRGGASQDPPGPLAQSRSATSNLSVGPANDRYEQEADRVARRVVGETGSTDTVSRSMPSRAATVQRFEHPQVGPEGGRLDDRLARELHGATAGGRPVPEHIRQRVAQVTGTNLPEVKVHDQPKAHDINRKLGAKASTYNNHILLGKGESEHDLALMAHELTHFSQQRASGTMQIQRKLNFKMSDIPPNVRKRAKGNLFRAGDKLFQQIIETLNAYWTANKESQEVKYLKQLRMLLTGWMNGANGGGDVTTRTVVDQLYQAVVVELPEARQRHTQLQKQQESNYIGQLQDYSQKSGAGKSLESDMWFTKEGKSAYTNSMALQQNQTDDMVPGRTAKAMNFYKQSHLSPAQLTGIQTYTGEDYTYINPAMAGNDNWLKAVALDPGGSFMKVKKKYVQDQAKLGQQSSPITRVDNDTAYQGVKDSIAQQGLTHAKFAKRGLKKLPDWQGQLFRGESMDEARFRVFKKLQTSGKSYTLSHFWSMSKDRRISEKYVKGTVPVLFVADVHSGKDVEDISLHEDEREVILLPGSQFIVIKIKNEVINGNQARVIYLRQK